MPKERSLNPVQAQRKVEKQKQVARQKKQVQAQRTEKLAHRNPERLQQKIDDLKALGSSGALPQKDKESLQQLEKDLKLVKRAREALGDAAPKFASRQPREEQKARREAQSLGKRRRGSDEAVSSDSDGEVDPEVRNIPMPRDTPPPIPREFFNNDRSGQPNGDKPEEKRAPAQTVYSSAPQLRDLKKEAVQFVPSVVAQQKRLAKGQGRLLEPEELERLEKAGYRDANKAADAAAEEAVHKQNTIQARSMTKDAQHSLDEDEEVRMLEAELAQVFPEKSEEVETRPGQVGLEEVEDEGD